MFNKKDFEDALISGSTFKKYFSHIVIGSGPGGAVTGCSLAEAGREVLMIEEGDYYDLDDLVAFSIDEMKYKYRNGGLTLAFGKIKINYVEGKCVGGGSEVNSGLYHRISPDVLAAWKNSFGLTAATEEELEPYYKQCEQDVKISYNPGRMPLASLKLAEGARAKGWNEQEVPRWFSYDGGTDQHGNAAGVKMSMTQTYLPRFMKAGGKLLTGTRCISFYKTNGQFRVTCVNGTQRFELICDHLFMCAGAIQTPTLLRRSGFTKNIGKSFLLHPTIKVTALFEEQVNEENMGVPVHQVKEFSPRFSFGCSISTPAYLAMAMNDHPKHSGLVREHWKQMAIYYAMTSAEGKGSVTNLPLYKDPLVAYGITKEEKEHLAEGLKKLCELLFAAGAKTLFPSITGSEPLTSVQQLDQLPQMIEDHTTNLMTIHLFSTCPIGENRERCAADSYGKLYGTENLYINDASMLPTAPGVNPQGAIMALALRNISHFINQQK